jgi:hypothetical protein
MLNLVGRLRLGSIGVHSQPQLFQEYQGQHRLRTKSNPVVELHISLRIYLLGRRPQTYHAAVQPRKKNLNPSCFTAVEMIVGMLAPPLAAITRDLTTSAGAQMATRIR